MRSKSSEKGEKSQSQELKFVLNTSYAVSLKQKSKLFTSCAFFFFTLLVAKVINASP